MEPKHRELLQQCHQNLVESVTDADRLLTLLEEAGTLTLRDRQELDTSGPTDRDKVDLLLKMLLVKDKDHFQDLRVALEKTEPHLLSILYLNGMGSGDTAGSTYSVLTTMPSDSESSGSLSSVGMTNKASSPPPSAADSRHMTEKLDTILSQLRQVTRERDELRKRLALSSPGSTFDDCRPSPKLSPDYERLKVQCMKAMTELEALQSQHSKALKKCEEAAKEADFYHTLHSRVLSDQTQLQEDSESLRRKHAQLQREFNHLQQSCQDLKRMHEADQKEISELRRQQQLVVKQNGSSELINKLYDTALDKLEIVKKDYDTLRKQYNEKVSSHNLDLGRLEQSEEEKRSLQKQLEGLQKQRDSALHLQHQYTSSMRRYDSIQQELNKATLQNKELQREVERLQAEATRFKTMQLKAAKDAEKYKEERDSVFNEYRLIMSERDQVIKEMDKMQTELELAQGRLKNTSSEKRVASEEMEALRQIQDSATLDMERANKEIEVLRKQYEAMSHELKEATQEAEVAKCRRDWAFQERDKIVAERESIRTLCDNLRRERDRAVSELAEALRNLDDMRKQKNDATRELKELKEKMDNHIEKEARFRQLMAHSSHDSAIDTDSLEWETEVVEFERDREDMDLKALGFDVADGVNEPFFPGDSGIFVTKVDKGSIADGRLRVNDCLLKINDVDLTNKDRKQLIKAVLSGGDVINMVIRRRKSLGNRIVTPLHISLGGQKDSGISLETGVLVAAVMPGSPAAKEGTLMPGDRVVAINGITLDNKSITECEALLRSCRDSLSLSLLKIVPPNTSWSGQNLFENLKESCRVLPSNIHAHNKRNLKNNSSTQTDIFRPDMIDHKKEIGDCSGSDRALQLSCHSHSEHSLGSLGGEVFIGRGYELLEEEARPLGYPDAIADVIVDAPTGKRSSGTWPKVMVSPGHSQSEFTVFKRPRQRKSIFDPDTFKRPQTPTKLAYMPPGQIIAHSPQPSKVDRPPTPPTPPKRSDSIKFKHRHQSSSASDSTVTAGSPPTSPSPASIPSGQEGSYKLQHSRGVGKCCRDDGSDCALPGCRGVGEVEGCLQRAEEPEVKRPRPLSAPALKHRLAPVSISHHALQAQKFSPNSEDRLSPDIANEWVRFSPTRSPRHSDIFTTSLYGSGMSGTVPRSLAPCPAVTAVCRNPIYTAWSHRLPSNNCPSSTGQVCSQHLHQSAQHHGRLSLDLSHKHPNEYCDTSRPRVSHGSNSLPSSARLGSSRIERIKIPSTPRYMRCPGGSDRGSLSQSECSSPSLSSPPHSPLNLETSSFASSQSQNSIASLPRISISTVPMGERRKDSHYYLFPHVSSSRYVFRTRSLLRLPARSRPRFSSVRCLRPLVDEPRHVRVQKGAEPLGISIGGGESGGIFVSKVMAGSIAQQAGLEYGDQLLEFNGINLRNATEQQARLIIGQQCDTITILAQYNPHMCQPLHSRSSSRLDTSTSHSTPHSSGAATPDNHSVIDTVSEQDEGTMTPPSKETTPSTSPRSSLKAPVDGIKGHAEVRTVTLSKSPVELGMQICGGNLHGIFVMDFDEDSATGGVSGLLTGDLILEYGSVDMRNKTAEEAYLEMLKPTENVKLKIQHKLEEFNKIKDQNGDGFYVRALYDRTAENPQELSFKKDDILFVDDTLPQGAFGAWMSWQLDENAQKLERGQIPSKYMMEQEFSRRLSVSEAKDEGAAGKTLSAAARRSFFRRKHKHKRSGSKDGKELQGLDTISTDSIPFLDESLNLAYQRVQRVDCTSPRPVLILGPLVDAVKDMLVKESPGRFCRCPLEVMKASQQAIERGVKDCLFIDYKRRSGHFDVTTVASIKEITEKNCHCLLDIAPHAIERLHSVHIYPIVLFIRYKSTKQIKEQKDPIFLRDKVTQKNSKEQFESAQKVEQEYSKYFTAVIQGGALINICNQILVIVEQEQNKALWIPANAL
ncbi:disks large homolog 5 isoform X3 [Pyxicephalus adspersus]|uniref:disks large homolog 5 isoform X3 n=1 Tax=Pyxicephalus adspersus TaxID=30357 RepID=UPI003B5B0F5F